MTAFVYRVYDADDALLYVGCTSMTVEQRMVTHRKYSLWRSRIARVTEQPFGTRFEARWAEHWAIWSECPRWNVQSRCHSHPDGLLSLPEIARRYPGDVTRPAAGRPAADFDRRICPELATA